MLITLDEINKKLKYFCDINYNVSEYVEGGKGEFTPKDHNYPLIYSVPVNMSVGEGIVDFIINLTIMDLIYDKEDDVKKLSDLSIILTEIKTYFNDDSEELGYFCSLKNTSNFSSFNNDKTVGWNGDVVFSVYYSQNRNRINAKTDIIPDGSQPIYWGTSLNTTLTEEEIKNLTYHYDYNSRVRTIILNGNGKYIFYCYPTSFGEASIMVNGFQTEFIKDIVSVDDVDYYTYRSQFIQHGYNIKIIIT